MLAWPYPTLSLALSAKFLGLTMLYLASSEGGGLMAKDHSLPDPGNPGTRLVVDKWPLPFEYGERLPLPLKVPWKENHYQKSKE